MKKNYITPLIEVCETELQGMIMTSPGGTNLSGVTHGNEEEKPTEFAKEHDIHIYNATRGGHLEAFERVDFDSLF